jgi:hypothetical protein
MTTITDSHDIALESPRPVFTQDSLYWLMLALLIVIIASWYFGLYRAALPSSPRTTPIHHLDYSCGGVATPC